MEIVQKKPSELIPYKNNNRKHPKEQIDKLVKQIAAHGFDVPIVVDENNVIIKGHGRLTAAKKLKLKAVPCIVRTDLNEEQKNAARLADNKLSEIAEIDMQAIQIELDLLKEKNFDLDLTAFDSWDPFADKKETKEGLIEDDEVPEVEQAEPICKLGDIWQLGKHRLMCGDSTEIEQVNKLMEGQKADMVFTDPPYNIASHSNNHAAASLRKGSYGKLAESEWDKNFDIKSLFPSIEYLLAENCTVYISTSHFLLCDIIEWMRIYFDYSNVCVWKKPNPMPSLAKRHYTWGHEFVTYGTKGKHIFNFPDEGHAHSVWEINKSQKCDLHPTMKPVAIPEHAILHSSNENQLIIDLFLGSGSTLIACEKTNRVCYGMELDPHYCDVIIARYEKFTGNKAVKVNL